MKRNPLLIISGTIGVILIATAIGLGIGLGGSQAGTSEPFCQNQINSKVGA